MSEESDRDADTIDEFARRNRLSRAKVYLMIAAGELKAKKVGTRTLIFREDAAAWRASLPVMEPAK